MLNTKIVLLCVAGFFAGAHSYGKTEKYSVPEPKIEAFAPKGLRLTIPDDPTIKSVQFFLSFTKPIVDNDPGTIAKEVDDKQGSHWIYYNPTVVLKPHDMVHFKIIVTDARGLQWSRWGSYPIDKVVSLADNSIITADCDDEGQQVDIFPNIDDFEPSGKQKSEVKSAYSMYKSMEAKPITRQTTTTTSGTYYVKPGGVVEASGYKTASSYDSTRRDGEQWQHSKSGLSNADIEELTRLHGQDFMSLPAFAHLNMQPGLSGVRGSSSHSSYSSSSSTSSQGRPSYGGGSYLQHQEIGQTSDALPLIRGPSSYSSFSKFEKQEHQASKPVSFPSSAISYSSSDSSYVQQPPQNIPSSYNHGQEVIPSAAFTHGQELEDTQSLIPIASPSSYSTVSKHYKKETVQTASGSTPVVATYPSPSGSVSNSKVTETFAYTAPKTVSVHVPLGNQPYYNGDIFRYSIRPTSPDSCSASEYSYKSPSQIDVVALERTVKENQCLSVLAESVLKAEVRALKEANTELRARFDELDQQFQRFRKGCQCGY